MSKRIRMNRSHFHPEKSTRCSVLTKYLSLLIQANIFPITAGSILPGKPIITKWAIGWPLFHSARGFRLQRLPTSWKMVRKFGAWRRFRLPLGWITPIVKGNTVWVMPPVDQHSNRTQEQATDCWRLDVNWDHGSSAFVRFQQYHIDPDKRYSCSISSDLE